MCRAHMGWVPHVLVCAGWQMANLLAAELAGFRGDHVECLNPFAGWCGRYPTPGSAKTAPVLPGQMCPVRGETLGTWGHGWEM